LARRLELAALCVWDADTVALQPVTLLLGVALSLGDIVTVGVELMLEECVWLEVDIWLEVATALCVSETGLWRLG